MSKRVDGWSCLDVLDQLDAWIDGDLGATEAAAVEEHVHRCASCQAARREAEELVTVLRSLPVYEIPETVVRNLREETRSTAWDRFGGVFSTSVFRPLPALAAIAAVVLMAVLFSLWGGPDAPQLTEQEVERATKETKLALAYVGSAARRVEKRVKDRVLDEGVAAETVRGVNRSLKFIGEAAAASADLPATPLPQAKGS